MIRTEHFTRTSICDVVVDDQFEVSFTGVHVEAWREQFRRDVRFCLRNGYPIRLRTDWVNRARLLKAIQKVRLVDVPKIACIEYVNFLFEQLRGAFR